jgi:lysine decarboxylase
MHTMSEMKSDFSEILRETDALFITSPNYYGDIADWVEIRKYCDETGKALLVDGAHGGHLHYDKKAHASAYADLWVDGVHKNLPALTQGAVVSARTAEWAEALSKAVDIFRTTSPSYPIMASVEYAVKYPRNEGLENVVRTWAAKQPRVKIDKDWTKVCALFGEHAFEVEKELESMGIYSEFRDGNVVMFYLSPATKKKAFSHLVKKLSVLFEKYPYIEAKSDERVHTPLIFDENVEKEWVDLEKSTGRVCAGACGLFPPCTPLFSIGERITEEKLQKLWNANNVFGIKDGKILVVKE